jgi:hypothetical protein
MQREAYDALQAQPEGHPGRQVHAPHFRRIGPRGPSGRVRRKG